MKLVSHRRGRTAVPASIATRQARYFVNRGRSGALALGLAAAAAAAVAVPASASAAASDGPSPVVGHVYVNDNTKPANTIGAFDRHADGTLTRDAGSPFAAGGAGTGSGLASQGALQFSADGRFLIAVDAGSNQISVLRVHSGGSLSLVPGGVVSSRGTLPDSLAVHGDLVYVANSGAGHSNYTGFRLGFGGRLFHIPRSTVPLASGAAPGDVLFNGTGTKLAGTEVGTSVIDSFTVGSGGRLTAAPGSPFKAEGLGPFGSEFRPTNPGQLFVSNAHNTATDSGTISSYSDSFRGTLGSARTTGAGATAGLAGHASRRSDDVCAESRAGRRVAEHRGPHQRRSHVGDGHSAAEQHDRVGLRDQREPHGGHDSGERYCGLPGDLDGEQ
jgi:hypothetical protein